jgi:hypothetical protein
MAAALSRFRGVTPDFAISSDAVLADTATGERDRMKSRYVRIIAAVLFAPQSMDMRHDPPRYESR